MIADLAIIIPGLLIITLMAIANARESAALARQWRREDLEELERWYDDTYGHRTD